LIHFCCETCLGKWKNKPQAYLIQDHLPQFASEKLPARDIQQVYCPVYKDRVVSSTDPFVMYQGKKVYLFNQSAVRKWQADPEKYADPAILPQLR
jgi:YHS domain-containing protein